VLGLLRRMEGESGTHRQQAFARREMRHSSSAYLSSDGYSSVRRSFAAPIWSSPDLRATRTRRGPHSVGHHSIGVPRLDEAIGKHATHRRRRREHARGLGEIIACEAERAFAEHDRRRLVARIARCADLAT
jgi:hypothetical protein